MSPDPDERGAGGRSSVSPDLYTEDYYLSCASGADVFESSRGLAVSPVLLEAFDRLGVGAGRRVLDIGCGRGEAVFNAAKRGAVGVGIDYADAALGLASRMLRSHPDIAGRVVFLKTDAKAMPLPTGSIDVAFMLDVVEHLHPWELDATLREVRRVLRPGGELFVHTMPNLHYYRWAYPVLRAIGRVQRQSWPREPRSVYEHDMHVNEQTPGRLRHALRRVGFDTRIWVDGLEKYPLRHGRLDWVIRVAARRPPFRSLLSFHIFAIARK
ncbi:MAG: class I SAM-dependent methyltransferase [Acidimicrobiales bacterium]